MKKKILSIVLITVLLIPTAAYAKGQNGIGKQKAETKTEITTQKASDIEDNNQKPNVQLKNINSQSKTGQTPQNKTKEEAKKLENNTEKEQFKAQIRAKHEIMKTNTKKINELKKQINTKKQELASILADIKAGIKTLPSDQLDLLLAKAEAVKETADAVKALPAVSPDVDNTEQNFKSNKFEAALSSLDKVITKQEARYAKLVELNSKLDDLLAIARQAQPVTTVDTTTSENSSASTDTNSSTTSTDITTNTK